MIAVVLLLLFLTSPLLEATDADADISRPHWIPVGSVSRELENSAASHRAFLQSRSREIQRAGLRAIRADMDRFNRADLRIAVVPIVVDMLGMEYTILSVSSNYHVDPPTRVEALGLLADIGGERARVQIRDSLAVDADPSVRVTAAALLSRHAGGEPDADLVAVAHALYRAVRRGGPEDEVSRLLAAAAPLTRLAWNPEVPELLHSLSTIISGPYSSSLRNRAFSMLEELARR